MNDDSLDIIVEVMGGIEPTVDWLRTALKNKKHVITANKDLLAVHLKLLEDLAEEKWCSFKVFSECSRWYSDRKCHK